MLTQVVILLICGWRGRHWPHCCVIIKHTNACGVAISTDQVAAWDDALASDPESAFGCVIAFNTPVSKKTAERIVVELKDKMEKLQSAGHEKESTAMETEAQILDDAVAALISLGYKPPEAQKRIQAAKALLGKGPTLDQLIKAGLKS